MTSPKKAGRQLFSDKTRRRSRLDMNVPSTQHYQQRFINLYYISDNVTVKNTGFFPQKLLHPIVNNRNLSLKEPSHLRVITKLTYQFEIKYIFLSSKYCF